MSIIELPNLDLILKSKLIDIHIIKMLTSNHPIIIIIATFVESKNVQDLKW